MLKPGALPTLELPIKSHETPKSPERRELVRYIQEQPDIDEG